MLKAFLNRELPLALFWLVLGLSAGLVYSLELLGMDGSMSLLNAERARSLHLSLMLYGFVPLMLSLLPFALFEKEGVLGEDTLRHLRRYFIVWNAFLLVMTFSLLFGKLRGLPFYDFAYQLNFILAFSGIFYLMALLSSLRRYTIRPIWVNVSLGVVITAPLLLLLLMNPQYGQVEKSLIGPHGDNTLGMSFALIPLYYLLIKLSAENSFSPAWNALWIVPLAGYGISLFIRNFLHPLSYNEEWFFQYLTLLYLPLLWKWWKQSALRFHSAPYLFISILAFVFVDMEGNILFIPQIREWIHRNDLVIGHAHIAMGIAVAFMAFSILHHYLPGVMKRSYAIGWSVLVSLMALALTIAGMIEAGWLSGSIEWFWGGRTLLGAMLIVLVGMILFKEVWQRHLRALGWYHMLGFMSDFAGGIFLILLGGAIFPLLGFDFSGRYEYVVFAFMMGTGMIHWYGYLEQSDRLASLSATIRLIVASVFGALYLSGILDEIALLVAGYDALYAMLYFLWLRDKR